MDLVKVLYLFSTHIVRVLKGAELDSRKEAILEAVVREYIESGQPVGSIIIVEKFQFPFSTATVRAEMAELERLGFLTHPHTSAGRIPTEIGYRYFVDMIEAERALAAREEHAVHKRLASIHDRFERQLDAASEVLSELTRSMGFAGTSGSIFSHGLGNLFSFPELLDPMQIIKTAELIDNLDLLYDELPKNFGTRIYIGSEAPIGKSAGVSIILSEFQSPIGARGYLGIMGPMRMSYERNLAAINEVKNALEEKDAKKS